MARILIVDDEAVIRDTLEQTMRLDGHHCDLAESAASAMHLLAHETYEEEYDLILTDVNMPQMNGYEFLRAIMPRIESITPCIVITANGEAENVLRAIKVGAYDFIVKPWDLSDLRMTVRRGLQRREDLKFRRNYQRELEGRVEEALGEVKATYDATIGAIAALLEGKDTTTADHCERVRDLCSRVGRQMNLSLDGLHELELGAMLHDIGKHRIDIKILNKPGKLTDEEWVEMKKHPTFGADVCEMIPFLRGAADVVRNHHEKWDGSGYPAGLKGEAIPLSARIFMVVDAYDTITSKRSYKAAESPETAIAEIRRCAGAHFDPHVVEVFERIFPEIAIQTRQSMAARRDAFAVA